jgi:hypothetical protein
MAIAEQSESALSLIVDAIGTDAAVRLVETLGGTRWYVPQIPPALWVEALGAELAEKLTATFAGDDIRIPRDKRIFDALIARDQAAGLNQNQLALKYRIDVRSIQNALKRHRVRLAKAAQDSLFVGV